MKLNAKNASLLKTLNLPESVIEKIFEKKSQAFCEFLNGNSSTFEISLKKLTEIAKASNIPFAYLFLDQLPQEKPLLPDFRGNTNKGFSPALKSCIASSLKKQEWHRAYLVRNGYSKFLENKNLNTNAELIIEAKRLIGFSGSSKDSFKAFKDSLENHQFIVQQTGVAKNNTYRAISIEECRGYAIYDEYAPLIFINSKDRSKKGKIFTLLHELAHILLKQSGVSLDDFTQAIEYRCNEIAGEILMPSNKFMDIWERGVGLQDNITRLKEHFKLASSLAIATKALLRGLIDKQEYDDFKREQQNKFIEDENTKSLKGGDHYNNVRASNGEAFAKKVIIDTINGYETYKDALNLLDIAKLSTFDKLAEELGISNV
ncbi:ImmA/IrrE family metallo-endopeptidase [Helicobacter sp. 11S02596-1]|uniref:ImmA/IrrE family metallo-endopeptidase n=1 Tax=Helicobacter sp. 11S02596-1 TaxID=1476194 RepID=UPI000BCA228B|nr:ImmA/IrrE family metallo-endopeptidase [Helicobacter sp. 11S02596-1]PAF43527.1 hypothetical protein BJI48_04525 [Helicobacter sp. 11S02596-1]